MNVPVYNEFQEIYEESGIPYLFKDYVKRSSLILGAAFAFTAVTSILIHVLLLKVTGLRLVVAVLSLSFTASCVVLLYFLFFPYYRRKEMHEGISRGLVYSLSYMTVLSASGISIESIMERMAEVEENSAMKQLATKFMMDTQLFGQDVSSALEDVSRRSPSDVLKKLLDSINNNIKTSGDLKGLLTYEVDRLLQVQRDNLKKMLGTLTYIGEIYVAILVVAPILFILMITILSVLGSGGFGSSVVQLNLIVFFGIPVLASGLLIVLDTIVRGDE